MLRDAWMRWNRSQHYCVGLCSVFEVRIVLALDVAALLRRSSRCLPMSHTCRSCCGVPVDRHPCSPHDGIVFLCQKRAPQRFVLYRVDIWPACGRREPGIVTLDVSARATYPHVPDRVLMLQSTLHAIFFTRGVFLVLFSPSITITILVYLWPEGCILAGASALGICKV